MSEAVHPSIVLPNALFILVSFTTATIFLLRPTHFSRQMQSSCADLVASMSLP